MLSPCNFRNENSKIYGIFFIHQKILKKIDKVECEKERIFIEKFRIENIKILTEGINNQRKNDKDRRVSDEVLREKK